MSDFLLRAQDDGFKPDLNKSPMDNTTDYLRWLRRAQDAETDTTMRSVRGLQFISAVKGFSYLTTMPITAVLDLVNRDET